MGTTSVPFGRGSDPSMAPQRTTVLNAALASGMCLDMMIERLLDRVAETRP